MIRKKSMTETENTVVPKFALVLVIFLSVSLISVLMLERLADSESVTQAGSFDLVQSTQEFVGGEEMNVTAQNLTVRIPKNSLTWTGTISITTRDPSQFLVSNETDWSRPQVFSIEFLNQKATPVPGIIFSNPIQICFKMTSEQWKDFTERPDDYQVQYFAVENNPAEWETLPLKAYAGELCGLVNHLSLFALAMRIDSIPVTGPSLTPTPTPTRTRPEPTRTRSGSDRVVPTATPSRIPTATEVPPSFTPPPTDTPVPTDTPNPTDTSEPPPTDTSEPPPTDTPEPPTPEPPTPEPPPTETPAA